MFHPCLEDNDANDDEKDWQQEMAKSRNRQRKKRRDDAAVARFFDHVQDPISLRVLELLLDYSLSTPTPLTLDGCNCNGSFRTNNYEVKKEVPTIEAHDIDEILDLEGNEAGSRIENDGLYCQVVEAEEEKGKISQDFMDSEHAAISALRYLEDTDSEKTQSKRVKGKIKGAMELFARLLPLGKENEHEHGDGDDAALVQSLVKPAPSGRSISFRRSSIKKRRSPLYDTIKQLRSREQEFYGSSSL